MGKIKASDLIGMCFHVNQDCVERITKINRIDYLKLGTIVYYDCIRASIEYDDGEYLANIGLDVYASGRLKFMKERQISREEFNKEYMKVINKLIEINK